MAQMLTGLQIVEAEFLSITTETKSVIKYFQDLMDDTPEHYTGPAEISRHHSERKIPVRYHSPRHYRLWRVMEE